MSYDEDTVLVKNGKKSEVQRHWCVLGKAVKIDVEKDIM